MSEASSEPVLEFCRGLPGVTEDVKWGNDLVFSVGGKMFVAFGLPDYEPLSFKVHPAVFGTLTQQEGIRPAPYLAQHSWVSVASLNLLSEEELTAFIQESYALVAQKLSKKARERLGITAL